MGVGKSTVGSLVAQKMGRRFLDTDSIISFKYGISVEAIFENMGEAQFRKEEREIIKRLSRLRNVVISVGGGALSDERNLKTLQRTGILFWLRMEESKMLEQTHLLTARPLVKKYDSDGLRRLYRERLPKYDTAANIIYVDGLEPTILSSLVVHCFQDLYR